MYHNDTTTAATTIQINKILNDSYHCIIHIISLSIIIIKEMKEKNKSSVSDGKYTAFALHSSFWQVFTVIETLFSTEIKKSFVVFSNLFLYYYIHMYVHVYAYICINVYIRIYI